jgi:hypothetical protein
MTMHDAEIAITLMNRFIVEQVHSRQTPPTDVLLQGGMSFREVPAPLSGASDRQSVPRTELECLSFEDGSSATRLVSFVPVSQSTPWVAVEPLQKCAAAFMKGVSSGVSYDEQH